MATNVNGSVAPLRPRKIWQASLRTLLLFTLVTGTIAGLYGPDMVRAVRKWQTAPPQPPPQPASVQVPVWLKVRAEDQSDGYFESAETPLR
jgi:hypothetical protein